MVLAPDLEISDEASKTGVRVQFIRDIPVGSEVININLMTPGGEHYTAFTDPGEVYSDTNSIFVNVRNVMGTSLKDTWDIESVQRKP